MTSFAQQLVASITSLQMGQVFELHYLDGTMIMFERTGPGTFSVHQTEEDSNETMIGKMLLSEVPEWAGTISPYDVHGYGIDVGHENDLEVPRLQFNMSEIPNGSPNAINNETTFINENFMRTTRPANTRNYLYLTSDMRGSKAYYAFEHPIRSRNGT